MAASRGPPLLGFRALALALLLAILLLLGCSAPAAYAGAEGVLRQVVGRRGDDGGGGNFFEPFNVTYDHRAVLIGGKRRMLVSAGLHYPRATSEVSEAVMAVPSSPLSSPLLGLVFGLGFWASGGGFGGWGCLGGVGLVVDAAIEMGWVGGGGC